MSPRAAWRLEQLGFERVSDYVAGKMDWLASDRPHEGEALLVGRAVDRDPPTCEVGERVDDVRGRLGGRSDEGCIVVDGGGVLLGVVEAEELDVAGGATVGEVMRFGVPTIRASVELAAVVEHMQGTGAGTALVTRPDGSLVGRLLRDHAEHVLHEEAHGPPNER